MQIQVCLERAELDNASFCCAPTPLKGIMLGVKVRPNSLSRAIALPETPIVLVLCANTTNTFQEVAIVFVRDGETTIKMKFAWGEGIVGREENRPKTLFFIRKSHDNNLLKGHFDLSRSFVVIAQAPSLVGRNFLGKKKAHRHELFGPGSTPGLS